MLILSSGTKRQIVYNKRLCECCETKCSVQLSTNLEYCCFDAITKGVLRPSTKENIASVDCIKDASNNGVVLLEIKNQKPSNIEISDVSLKIKERSFLVLFLRIPQCTPFAVNPFAAQTPPVISFMVPPRYIESPCVG